MNSTLKTIFLLGILSVFLIVVGGAIGGRGGLYMAFILSLVINGISYFFSDRIALMASGAKEVTKDQAPELYAMIEDLAQRADIPMPKLYITPAQQANAFATGRDPEHASVAVTQGMLNTLPSDQVRAVLAHEIGHVKNRDILIASVAAVLASSIAFLSRMGLYGGFGGSSDNRRGAGGFAILLAIFGPIAAMLIQFAISRQREFSADAYGRQLVGDGEPLAQALININESTKRLPMGNMNPAFSSMYIGNPLGKVGGLTKLFSTHPPVEERVQRLRE